MADEHRELIAKDIVDQLRLHKPQFTAGVCSRAIQEITRLRAENAELRRNLAMVMGLAHATERMVSGLQLEGGNDDGE